MRNSWKLAFAAPGIVFALTACATGGGGSPPPPSPPPSPPPLGLRLTGPSLGATISTDMGGVVTNLSAPAPAFGNALISMDPGGATTGDETFRVQYPPATVDRDFRAADGPAFTYPGFNSWISTNRWTVDDIVLDIFDLRVEQSQAYEYLYPIRLRRGGEVVFGVVGTASTGFPSTLPERYVDATGIARFRGQTAGYFYDVDKRIYRTTSNVNIEVNLTQSRLNAIIGNTSLNADSPDPDLNTFFRPPNGSWFDFTFNAPINSAAMTFQGTTSTSGNADFGAMTGPVSGMFFGAPGAAPDELGFTFSLANAPANARYWGVGAADHDLAPRPFLTPMTTVNMGRGPSVMVGGAGVGIFGTRGAGSSITAATLLNVSPDVWASFSPGATMSFQDDAWTLRYAAGGVTFDGAFSFFAMPSYTVSPTTYSSFLGQRNNVEHYNIGFDLGPSLAGALDNVFLVSVRGDNFETNQNIGYMVFGTQAAVADMPTTGSATFAGKTRGVYLDATGQLFQTRSDLGMTASFGTGAINGSATGFSASGDMFPGFSSDVLDFTFAGAINSGASTFTANAASTAGGIGLTGNVQGAFYGAPGAAPDEVGLAYQLGSPGGGRFMAGGGLMAKQP